MTDVAQILGVTGSGGGGRAATYDRSMASAPRHVAATPTASRSGGNNPTAATIATSPFQPPPLPSTHQLPRAMKMQGLSREVLDLISGKSHDNVSAELPPIVPSLGTYVKVGSKSIAVNKPVRKWAWAPFTSSSRTDGLLLYHWVRAGVEYPDYPYARFDIHLDPVSYHGDEEYRLIQSDTWTRSETDFLLDLARRFELRWAVIHDRWIEHFYSDNTIPVSEQHKIEDLQHRFYSVAATLAQNRIVKEATVEFQTLTSATAAAAAAATNPTLAAPPSVGTTTDPITSSGAAAPEDAAIAIPNHAVENLLVETAAARALAMGDPKHQPVLHNYGQGTSNKVFDLNYERERRAHLEAIWNRTRQEEVEEAELRKELKQVEAQLRKIKKSGTHILAAVVASNTSGGAGGGVAMGSATKSATTGGGTASLMASAASSRNVSRAATPIPVAVPDSTSFLEQAFASTAPTPVPQVPYLQSGRLVGPAVGGPAGLNKALLSKMESFLEELKVPKRPIPTKRICDMYDAVRKDVLTLLILQKTTFQKEGLVEGKRLKLAKLGGKVHAVTEEALMGIAPTPAPAANAVTTATTRPWGSDSLTAPAATTAGISANPKVTGKSKPSSMSAGGGGGSGSKGGAKTSSKTKSSPEDGLPGTKSVTGSKADGKEPSPANTKQVPASGKQGSVGGGGLSSIVRREDSSGKATVSISSTGKNASVTSGVGGKQASAGGKQPAGGQGVGKSTGSGSASKQMTSASGCSQSKIGASTSGTKQASSKQGSAPVLGKQGSAASGAAAADSGSSSSKPGGKQGGGNSSSGVGGKQAKKTSTKRKRKAEGKSPINSDRAMAPIAGDVPPATSSTLVVASSVPSANGGSTAGIQATAIVAAGARLVASTTTMADGTPSNATTATIAPSETMMISTTTSSNNNKFAKTVGTADVSEAKGSGKKRSKKSNPSQQS